MRKFLPLFMTFFLLAANAFARAKLNIRVHPGQSVAEAQAAVMQHLKSVRPFGIPLKVTAGDAGQGFAAKDVGPAYEAARAALKTAWGKNTSTMAGGGSIPLVSSLQEAVPTAEILLFGCSDGYANIHAPNERVIEDELEKATVAVAEFFAEYAERHARDLHAMEGPEVRRVQPCRLPEEESAARPRIEERGPPGPRGRELARDAPGHHPVETVAITEERAGMRLVVRVAHLAGGRSVPGDLQGASFRSL